MSIRLKEERTRLGYTQEGFAALAAVSRRAYSEWEAGNTSPTAVQLAALAGVGADVQYIITGNRSSSALSPDEEMLLQAYRGLDSGRKAGALGAVLGLQQPAKFVVHGDVGQQIDSVTSSTISVSMSRKSKKKDDG